MGNGAASATGLAASSTGLVHAASTSPTLDDGRLSCEKPSAASKTPRSPKAKRGARRLGRWGMRSSRSPKRCSNDGSNWLGSLRRKASGAEPRSIQHVNRFSDSYRLGREVAQLSRRGTYIRHAMRRSDSTKVVVKVRERFSEQNGMVCGSFESTKDESEWRETMERYLNLPRHESIVHCHEILEDDKRYYVVMDRVKGLDLYDVLHKEGEFFLNEVREVMRQILSAAATLHAQRCIHKDLKLENVVLEREHGAADFLVRLIDFDTLTLWSPGGPPEVDVLGTDQYIAPEAYQGFYSPASDMFAVGVLAYRLLTSDFPFNNDTFDDEPGDNWVGAPQMEAICESLLNAEINWDYKVFQQEPGALEFCQRALAMDPARRPSALEALRHPWLFPASSSTCEPSSGISPDSIVDTFVKSVAPTKPERPRMSPDTIVDAFVEPTAPTETGRPDTSPDTTVDAFVEPTAPTEPERPRSVRCGHLDSRKNPDTIVTALTPTAPERPRSVRSKVVSPPASEHSCILLPGCVEEDNSAQVTTDSSRATVT